MKILELRAENLKRLTVVDIKPDGNLVQITGKNGQGKTSVLDAIWWALGGVAHVQSQPVRKGEERAAVRLDLGDIVVTRKFIAKDDGGYTTSIIVENGEGARFKSPQSMIDNLLGVLTFDPLEFTRMKPDQQAKAMRSLVKDFDFVAAETAIRTAFEKRTEANREAKTARATAATLGNDLPEEIPGFIDISEKLNEYQSAMDQNRAIENSRQSRASIEDAAQTLAAEIKTMQVRHAGILKELSDMPPVKELIDTEGLRTMLDSAAAVNEIAQRAEDRDGHVNTATAAENTSSDLTAEIDAQKAAMRNAIKGAELPVDGLTIEDGELFLNENPFNQASDAQKLSVSIGIAMAMNPKLKVIRVRDGSLLDGDAMKLLADMADQNDYQIWIERVDGDGKVGFVLEDGHIKGQDIEPELTSKPEPAKKQAARESKAPPATHGEPPSLFSRK